MESFKLKNMIADYMENGFLENIIDMFKHDRTLYRLAGELVMDERVRVRLGTSALIETMKGKDPENIYDAVPNLLPLFNNPNPVIRGDAAYLIGIIGQKATIPFLEELADNDKDADVRLIAKEAVEDIKSSI